MTRDDLVGKTIAEARVDPEDIWITFDDGTQYRQYHEQSCCENVRVEDVNPSIDTLVGGVLHSIVVETNEDENNKASHTWTFYKVHTSKGSVDIRWLGESNGYYSERVDESINGARVW
jgi:hypothetical protein